MSIAVDAPEPSQAEILLAAYGETWEIWREILPDGRHGDWFAETLHGIPRHRTLRASSVDALAERLREAEA